VTPTQLYGRLLPNARAEERPFRYGRGDMQIHLALSEPPRWDGDERLNRTAIVHLTPGLDGVSRSVNEADRGLLPEEATVVVGQPLTMDPSRAPEGRGLIWIQLQELPRRFDWTEEARERYADRIVERLARHVPNLSIIGRVVLSPADLERANINLVEGDPYSGALSLDQNFLWRPLPGRPGHATEIDGLWHIGASTHPGPGLGGGSGTIVAKRLLRKGVLRR
ncbi:MAG: phytoene desaturase family protein, partial [Gaiellaceae bacterium]